MKITIDGKEYSIKFGYKPTLKERILSKVTKLAKINDKDNADAIDPEKVEDLLIFMPEFLLVGLQVNHEEFRYDYDTHEGKKEKLAMAESLVEKYFEEGGDCSDLFDVLQGAMIEESFLAALFRKEQAREAAEQAVETKTEN